MSIVWHTIDTPYPRDQMLLLKAKSGYYYAGIWAKSIKNDHEAFKICEGDDGLQSLIPIDQVSYWALYPIMCEGLN